MVKVEFTFKIKDEHHVYEVDVVNLKELEYVNKQINNFKDVNDIKFRFVKAMGDINEKT